MFSFLWTADIQRDFEASPWRDRITIETSVFSE
jgi:hypothetical protein